MSPLALGEQVPVMDFAKGGWLSCVLILLLWGITGCSSEGGVVGSGISSLQGNVIDVQLAVEDDAAAADGEGAGGLEGDLDTVLVSIDETDLETLTDVDGFFSLDGSFSGAVTVRFRNPDDGELLGTFPLDIAPGATVFLRDVEIRLDLDLDDSVIVSEPLHLNLAGTVSEIDCANGVMLVSGDPPGNSQFTLHVTADTELVDSKDNPLSCSDLMLGENVVLEEGIVSLADRSIQAVKLVADPEGPPPRRTEIKVRRRGVVLRAECERGQVIYIADTKHHDLVRVEITPETRLTCPNIQACGCDDIAFGDVAEVWGVRQLVHADSLVAEEIRFEPNPDQFVRRVLTGDIRNIDCTGGTATIVDVHLADALLGERLPDLLPVEVKLLPETTYRCGNGMGHSCRCEDIGARYRVEIEALIPIDGGPIQTLNVKVMGRPRIHLRTR